MQKPHHRRAAYCTAEFLRHRGRREYQAGRGSAVFQLGVITDIGIHRPHKRRHHTREHRNHHLQQEHEQQTGIAVGRTGEEHYAEQDEKRVHHDERGFLAEPLGYGHSQRHAHHICHFPYPEEQTRVEQHGKPEHHDVLLAAYDVGKEESHYVTYILMMTVYTGINVPYGAMLGVMTEDSQEKTVFSSFRMFFAYGGSFIALFAWEPLCSLFAGTGMSLPAPIMGSLTASHMRVTRRSTPVSTSDMPNTLA